MAGVFVIASAFTISNITWKIKKDYIISFESPDASGVFTSLSGKIIFDPNNLKQSGFDVKIPVESIDTDNFLKNRHAKSNKWFDAEKYPYITYKSTEVLKTKSGYMVRGILTIRNVSKPVTIPFGFTKTGKSGTFEGFFTVNRMDYQIGKAGDIEDKINVKVTVPVTR